MNTEWPPLTRKRWRPLLRCSKVKKLLRLRRNQRKINIQECRGVPDVYLSGEDPRFYKRRVKQYPASLSGGLQSPTEINAPRGCAGIRFGRCQLTLTRIPRQFSRARIEYENRFADLIIIMRAISSPFYRQFLAELPIRSIIGTASRTR